MPAVEDINVEEELGNREEGLEGRPTQPGDSESEEEDGEELSFGEWLEDIWFDLTDNEACDAVRDVVAQAKAHGRKWITVGTRWLWILGTSLLVTAFPLLLEVEREQQARDVESAQVDFLRRQGYSPDQLAQIGLGEGGASA